MDPKQQQVEERIRLIRQRFIAAIPQFVNEINTRWQNLRHTGWDARTARQLQLVVHRLAGSGTTFGFPDVTRIGQTLDTALNESLEITGDLPPERLQYLERGVGDLLRILNAALAEAPQQAPAAAPAAKAAPRKAGELILIVDDDELLRARMAVLLEEAGYRVAAVADPAQVAAALSEETPSLVLLDLMFPGRARPAFDVVEEIRSSTGERTPVIVVSGRADFNSRLEATRAGTDSFLPKPIDARQLLDTIGQLVQQRRDDGWRCLVIDDDEKLATQLCIWLREGGLEAETVSNPRDSWLRVREFQPDVLVMDVNMPDCNGIELATLLRQEAQTALLPIVFLTGDQTARTRRDAVAAGADDFLLKPVDRETLLHSVKARAHLAKRLQERVSRITQQAPRRNGLSRHYFFNELERALEQVDDGPVQPALLLLALVESPHVVQQQGSPGLASLHEQWLARVNSSKLGTWSMVGENIVAALLPRNAVSSHQALVQEAMQQLSASPYTVKGHKVPSALCAATLHLRSSNSSVAAILLQAEQLLGIAISAGPGTSKQGYMGTAGSDTTESSGQFPADSMRAVYQPIVTIDGIGAPVNAVLARIADKDGKLMLPGRFMSVLEKRGWVPDLDAWVFRHAHALLTAQIGAEQSQFMIVHASPASLVSAVYVETVVATLAEQPMRNPNQCLIIAVPEAAWVTNRSVVEQLNTALQDAGGGLMITDYGSTAQAQAVLENLSPLFVRLQPELAQRLEHNSEYAAADRALMEAAQAANTGIIASGIENARSLSALWSKGVRRFQGYFIQEPGPVLHTEAGSP